MFIGNSRIIDNQVCLSQRMSAEIMWTLTGKMYKYPGGCRSGKYMDVNRKYV
jgi:hypothetical protein